MAAAELSGKVDTVQRYYRAWQNGAWISRRNMPMPKSCLRTTALDRQKNVELFARPCGISEEQLETILSKPHGLHGLMTGKLYFPVQAEADHKRHIALELGVLISEHLIKHKGQCEDVYLALGDICRRTRETERKRTLPLKKRTKAWY